MCTLQSDNDSLKEILLGDLLKNDNRNEQLNNEQRMLQ